ncbi:MAG: alpha/beta hydrolase [Burkholderiales bacterium]
MRAFRALLVWMTATSVVVMLGCASTTPRQEPPAAAVQPQPQAPESAAAESQAAQAAAAAVAADEAAQKMRALSGDCRAEFSGTCYPVWFGTNRKPIDRNNPALGFGSEADDHLNFGKRIVRIPLSHKAGELGSPMWQRLLTGADDRLTLDPATALSEDAFVRDVRTFLGTLDPADRNVLVYIHGFNTSFDEAAKRAAQLGFDLKVPGITAFYSWPSLANITAYVGDLSRMEASEQMLADFLVRATTLVDRGHVHLIAHSMGNRGLLAAMHRATTQAALRTGVRFGQIFLAAPDVDTRSFAQLASVYPMAAEHTTLYVADQDKALLALEWATAEARAGGAPPVLVLPGIDTVRVRGWSLFRLGHSYVAEDASVLRDIRTVLHWQESPERRRVRNGQPIPDDTPGALGAWVLGP